MQHRVFSPRRLAAIATNTLTELTRLKIFHVLLLFALFLIGSSLFVARLSFQQEFQVLKDIALGAMSLFTSLLAILATARLLPQDRADRTVYTILARPVPRFEYIIGKLAGVLLLLAISMLVMSALFFVVLFLREQATSAAAARGMAGLSAEQITVALANNHAEIFSANLLPGLVVIYLKACLLAALTLLISTFATTNIFTVVTTVIVYFIGHLQATAREFWLQEQGASWLGRAFLASVALLFPDLQLFDFSDEIITGLAIPLALFGKVIALGFFYIVLYLLLAIAVFNTREL
ncbi:MAG: hypothetical protein ABIR71_00265 [Chthoniobacterales bacterium]